ncbi:MAG: hypothetical protein J6A15_08645 [Clostridia bacterium]|nr:hypothetical protein [Clostridia bacterium]MBP3681622.1 hypothetical protein [Clostridia bacterium]
MRDTFLDRLIIYLAIALPILCIINFVILFLLTNGIRIDREYNTTREGLKLTEYEQVYHVFSKQEIFLSISNDSEQMIGTLTVRENTSGKTETIHKVRPGDKKKLYFSLDSYFKNVDFEIIELKFVEMY